MVRTVKRVLLTGHKGFIGQNMYLCLCRHGIEPYGLEKGDTFDPLILKNVDAVIHLGAISSTTETNRELIMRENFDFSKELYSYCCNEGVLFQYASSASVYGDSITTREYDKYTPKNIYGESKYLFDLWMKDNASSPYHGFRYFNVWGRKERHKGDQASPISKFIWQARENGKINVFEESSAFFRDFVFVEDVCVAHLSFLYRVEQDGVWNVGTGHPISFMDVAEEVVKKIPAEIQEIPMPQNLKSHYQKFTKADLTRFNEVVPNFRWRSVKKVLAYSDLSGF